MKGLIKMNAIFARFFSDMQHVCGHEKTFHAAFCHQLLLAKCPKNGFAREYRLGKSPVDVVLFASQSNGSWSVSEHPMTAIEFKGGAYGTRNALQDTIDVNGHCADLDKLMPYQKLGIECWFVCIDVLELGISLSESARRRVSDQCAERGIRFAYYAQGESHFLISDGKGLQRYSLTATAGSSPAPDMHWRQSMDHLPALVRRHSASEDTYAGMAYHALRLSGFGPSELSLETYFNCAAGNTRMQNRPDLCVFDKEINGRFNLYRQGNPKYSNDGVKLKHLRALIEVKGSSATEKMTDARFAKSIAQDIEKLGNWRSRFEATGYLSPNRPQPDYVMLAIDNRSTTMRDIERSALVDLARHQNVHFHYLHSFA